MDDLMNDFRDAMEKARDAYYASSRSAPSLPECGTVWEDPEIRRTLNRRLSALCYEAQRAAGRP